VSSVLLVRSGCVSLRLRFRRSAVFFLLIDSQSARRFWTEVFGPRAGGFGSCKPAEPSSRCSRFLQGSARFRSSFHSARLGLYTQSSVLGSPTGPGFHHARALSPIKISPARRLHCGSLVPLRNFVLRGRWPNRAKARCCLLCSHRQSAGVRPHIFVLLSR
jgi:hypothetical protein